MRLFRRVFSLILITSMLFSLSCEAFASTLTLPAALEVIGDEAFYGDESLDDVVVPYGATTIGERAFAYSGLKQITIPDTVTDIAEDAFEGVEDVVIVSSSWAPAKTFAIEHNIPWIDTDLQEFQEEIDSTEDVSFFFNEDRLLAKLDTEQIELPDIPDGGSEYAAFLSSFNERQNEYLNAVQEYNNAIADLEDRYTAYNTLLDNFSTSLVDGKYTLDTGSIRIEAEESLLDDAANSYEVVSATDYDGNFIFTVREDTGSVFYINLQDQQISMRRELFTDNETASINYASSAPATDNDVRAIAEDPISNTLNNISNIISVGSDIATLTRDNQVIANASDKVDNFVDGKVSWYKDQLTYLNGKIAGSTGNTKKLFEKAYSEAARGQSLWRAGQKIAKWGKCAATRVSNFFENISPAGDIYSIYDARMKREQLYDLRDHGHPLDDEQTRDALSIVDEMNWNIDAAFDCFGLQMAFGIGGAGLSCLSCGAGTGAVKSTAKLVKLREAMACSRAFRNVEKITAAGDLIDTLVFSGDEYFNKAFMLDDKLHYELGGVVTEKGTRKQLQNVTVICRAEGLEDIQTKTDAEGMFAMNPLASKVTLIFRAEGYNELIVPFPEGSEELVPDYKLFKGFILEPSDSYTLSGIVTDQRTGAGIAGATVTLDDGRTTTSGADGQYSFSKVAPGSHTISAVKTRYNITSVDVFVSNHDKYQKIILTSENIPKTEFNSAFWEWCVSQFDGTYDAEKDKIVYDGELSKEEAEAVTEIYCKENGFSSLQGIKYFVNLEILGCHHNNLTSLDVSGLKKLNRIICNNNQLQSVDLSGCTALSVFECEVNQLTRLDLSGYKELTKVSIYNNPLTDLNLAGCTSLSKLYVEGGVLTNLNVSNCINLESLCCHHNYLTSLNLSGCRKLKTIICNNNQLTSIDVSDCPLLETFEFEENLVQSLDLSGHSALNNLGCSNNPLERLNLSNCSSLPVLHISSAQLTSLVLSGCSALTELVCPNNKLTSLDVSDCPKLEMLICFNNKLTNLDVSGCTALTELACFNNTLTALDVSDCSSLSSLACNANRLTALDVSHNKALTKLGCLQNRLTSLDVSGLTTLTELICYENQLTSLNVSGCAALQILNAHTNQLPTLDVSECAAMTKLVCAGNKLTSLDLTGCEALTELVCQGNPLTSLVCVGNKLTNLDLSGCTTLTELVCQENPMTSLNLSGCVALTKVLCQNNELASLDVSGLTALAELICYENQITSLNVTGCTALERLNAHTNQLTSLDVSGFTALTKLVCAGNQLTSLDLSGCFALTELACQANNLTSLNVSGCKALQKLECMNNQLTRINVADCEALTDANITCDSGVTIVR